MENSKYIDDIVAEYLAYRGFTETLASFKKSLQNDPLGTFNPAQLAKSIISAAESGIYSEIIIIWDSIWEIHGKKYNVSKNSPLCITYIQLGVRIHQLMFITMVKKRNQLLKSKGSLNEIKQNEIEENLKQYLEVLIKMNSDTKSLFYGALRVITENSNWVNLVYSNSQRDNENLYLIYCSNDFKNSLMTAVENFLSTALSGLKLPTILAFKMYDVERKAMEAEILSLKARIRSLEAETHSKNESAIKNDIEAESETIKQ